MLNFKEKIPYCLNEEVLKKLMLFPCQSSEYQIENKEPMLLYDFLVIVAKEVYKESPAPVEMTVVDDFIDLIIQVGSKYYGFKADNFTFIIKEKEDEAKAYSRCALDLLKQLLNLIKVSKDISGTLYYTWYFFKSEVNSELPGEYFRFFVCQGDQIKGETVLIEAPGWAIPENLLIDKRDDKMFDRMDGDALTIICYRKWTKETLSGQIYAVTKELEASETKELEASENDSIADMGLQQVNVIEIITLFKNMRKEIMYGIVLICILLFLILIRIH
jgi:hypothetical protein